MNNAANCPQDRVSLRVGVGVYGRGDLVGQGRAD